MSRSDELVSELMSVDVDSWTMEDIEKRLRYVAQEMALLIREQSELSANYAQAEADYKRAYHLAHLEICVAEPDWTVTRRESYAEVEALEAGTQRIILKERKATVRSSIEGWSNILDILRSLNTTMRGLSGNSGQAYQGSRR